jgi:hypothetical protein
MLLVIFQENLISQRKDDGLLNGVITRNAPKLETGRDGTVVSPDKKQKRKEKITKKIADALVELSDIEKEEKKEKRRKAKLWMLGQQQAKKEFNPEAYNRVQSELSKEEERKEKDEVPIE